jgi:sialate O-acetylesterase
MKPAVFGCVWIAIIFLAPCSPLRLNAQPLPQEDVVDVPAIGEGLCFANLFQTNMVLQRDKPIHVWGWADVGEQVSVSFAGEQVLTQAGGDRAWKVTLSALAANSTPQRMTVQGKSQTVVLENILVGDVWVLGGQSNMEFELAKARNNLGKLPPDPHPHRSLWAGSRTQA